MLPVDQIDIEEFNAAIQSLNEADLMEEALNEVDGEMTTEDIEGLVGAIEALDDADRIDEVPEEVVQYYNVVTSDPEKETKPKAKPKAKAKAKPKAKAKTKEEKKAKPKKPPVEKMKVPKKLDSKKELIESWSMPNLFRLSGAIGFNPIGMKKPKLVDKIIAEHKKLKL